MAGSGAGSDGQKPIVPVRFPPTLAATAALVAEQDGMTISAWIRQVVGREIVRREGKCPTCGRPAEVVSE
jgi:wobble nucleotide-excising tRNase